MDKDIYQELIIELYQNPLNFGELEDADAKAEVYNATCGDRIVIYIKIKDGKIADVKFTGKGCAISQASASLFTDVIKGMEVDEVMGMGKDDILKLLRVDLSRNPTRIRCALLVLDAFKKAIKLRQ
ncbi:MAG: Fe-S cluster assembly sulfur transfer protein SufU [Candidatus Micrarchaeota archaeon]